MKIKQKEIDLMRPKELYDNVIIQRKKDGLGFYDRYHENFIETHCPACEAKGKLSFKKWGFHHNMCDKCGTLYVSPRPDELTLNEYYTSFEAAGLWTKLLLEADIERKKLQYIPRIELVFKMLNKMGGGGIAIDIGAGSGAFSKCLSEFSVFDRIIALDISEECVESCKKQGLESYCCAIEDWKDTKADVIFANDLIEHVFHPKEFLKTCYNMLKNDGAICLATPNCEGFDFKILKENTGNITPPEHLNYFNPYSIQILLKDVGFKEVIVKTPGILDVDIILKSDGVDFKLKDKNEYLDFMLHKDDNLQANFQQFLIDNMLSSHMLVIGKKED